MVLWIALLLPRLIDTFYKIKNNLINLIYKKIFIYFIFKPKTIID